MASARKTGGGPADGDLNKLKLKISSIKGKEAFEGIQSGFDLSIEYQYGDDETESMMMSSTPCEEIEEIKNSKQAPKNVITWKMMICNRPNVQLQKRR